MERKPASSAPKKRSPRRISARYLENAALHYLQRYASSAENLRRVLTRKVDRSCAFHNTDPAEFYPVIDALLTRYTQSGLLNDKVYTEGRAASLRRQGRSRQAIVARLGTKGLARADIEAALDAIDADNGAENPELAAAQSLARRKKIGKHNPKPATDPALRQKEKQREMAAMARAGFSYDIARQALETNPDDDNGDFL